MLVAFALVGLVPLGLLAYSSVRFGDQAVRDQVQARLTEASTTASTLVGQQMQDLSVLVESYAERPDLVSALGDGSPGAVDETFMTAALVDLQRSQRGIAVAFLADRRGLLLNIIPSTPSIIGEDFSYRNWYQGVMSAHRSYVSSAYQTAATGHARVVAAAALIRGLTMSGDPGPTLGVLVAAYDLNTVQDFVDHFSSANNVHVTVTDQHGTVVAAPGAAGVPSQLTSLRRNEAVSAALAGRSGAMELGQGSSQVLTAYTPVPGLGWTVQADISTQAAFASARDLRDTVDIIAALLGAVLIAGLVLLAITMRRHDRSEQQRRESESFLDSVIENIPDLVMVKDARDLRAVRVNRAAEELLGQPRDVLLGRRVDESLTLEEAEVVNATDRQVLAGHDVVETPKQVITLKSGDKRFLHTKKIPLFNDDGTPQYLLVLSEDVTDRHADQVALMEAKESAERANQAKNEFLSRTSHELRTPLNSILGFAQLLELSDLDELDRDNNEQILGAGRHLLSLINELLDLSRAESGELSLSIEPVTVSTVVSEVAALMDPLAAARRLTIEHHSAASRLAAAADRRKLSQILLNLVSNAVKYNREGGTITIAWRHGTNHMVEIAVADTGPGLSPEQLDKIFLPFERLDAEVTEIEGTGIGLTLSMALAKAMGGGISVESEVGRGTTFVLHVPEAGEDQEAPGISPKERPAEQRPVSSTSGESHSLRVLYVEDNHANVQILERYLGRRPDVTLDTAMSGQLGVDLARQHHPDVVLLDLHLPDLTGDEVFERLRSDPQTAAIPVVMLSADVSPGTVNRLLKRGVLAYLSKPLDLAELGALLDEIEAAKSPEPS